MSQATDDTTHDTTGNAPPIVLGEHTVTGLLSEYDALKREQTARIGFRDQLLYATLTAVAAVAAVTATAGRLELLLVLPLAGVVLGWTHLHNDHMITEIGCYVRDRLGPRLAGLVDDATDLPMFEWETEHRHRGDRRVSRKWLQLGVNLSTFCLPPLAALVVIWVAGPRTAAVLATSLAELAMLALLATQITLYSGVRKVQA
jgi:uncharacterized membrane protein